MAGHVKLSERRPVSSGAAKHSAVHVWTTSWRTGFGAPLSSVSLAAQWFFKRWRLLLAIELGMVIAVALLATVPFYSDLINSLQVQSALASSASSDRNIQIDVNYLDLHLSDVQNTDQIVTSDAQVLLGSFTSGRSEYLDAARPLYISEVGGAQPQTGQGGSCVNVYAYDACQNGEILPMAYDLQQSAPYIKMYAGRLPQNTSSPMLPEVAVTPAMGIKPGSVVHFIDSQYPQWGFDAMVVGVWFPKDENNVYWNGKGFDTLLSTMLKDPPPSQYPVLFTREGLLASLNFARTQMHNPMGLGAHYVYYVAPSKFTASNVKVVSSGLKNFHSVLDGDVLGRNGVQDAGLETHLGAILDSVGALLAGQSQPLYSVDAQLVALALLFIFILSGLLIEGHAGEIATLKSRGASVTQVLLTYLMQGFLLAGVALVIGVVTAGALALALVRYFAPLAQGLSDTLTPSYVAASLSLRDALIPAAIGAGLSVIALGVAALQAARKDALVFRREQGRSVLVPFWKRYYLDLGLVVLCVAGYMELISFGNLATRTLLNDGSNNANASRFDLIQLLAPTLMLLAGALLLQRALPVAVRVGAWLTTRRRGAIGMLAFSQISRASGAFNRLTLLLTLAVGLGLFSLTFQTTLARSATDDANYAVGADERVVIQPESQGTQSTALFAQQFAAMPGVRSVSPTFRGIGLTPPDLGGQTVDVLAVDPATYAQTAIWRSDYADKTLPSLMNLLARAPHGDTVGQRNRPLVALVDQTFANNTNAHVGDRFQLSPQEDGLADTGSRAYFIVGGIVNAFPTMYDENPTGCVVVNLNDYLSMLGNPDLVAYPINGPNEFLLRTTDNAAAARLRAAALTNSNFFVQSTLDSRALARQYGADPLAAGMSGLLLLGMLITVLLALVGVVVQASVAARQRQTQFAILRTLGLSEGALTIALLMEQALIYLFGALGGVAIGALLSVASLPFLGFNSASYTPPVIGVPSSVLAVNLTGSLIYLGLLLAIVVVALVVMWLIARSIGLGRALRIGDD